MSNSGAGDVENNDSANASRKQSTPDGLILTTYMRETNGGGCLENVPGYPVRRALTDGFATARLPTPQGYSASPVFGANQEAMFLGSEPIATGSILPLELQQPQYGANLENVFGVDNRVMVPDTATIPWRCICHLQIIFDNGIKGFGKGLLEGHRTVMTAGHCFIDPRTKAHAAEIYITPGRSGPIGPYGQFTSTNYAVMDGWPDSKHPELDLAAIGLNKDDLSLQKTNPNLTDNVGERLGYFGVAAFSDERLQMLLVNTAGYPLEARKPFATQWYNGGRVKEVFKTYLTYMIDTEGGQSGSSVFFYDQTTDQRLAVAIYTTGYYPNRGLRVTPKILEVIEMWIKAPPSGRPPLRKDRRARTSATKTR